MKILQQIIFFSILTAVIAVGCSKDELRVEPRQSISQEVALTKRANVVAAVNSVYAGLKSTALYGRDLLAVSDALSDITRATNRSGRLVPENNNQLRAHLAFWGTAYSLINEINLILDAAPSVSDASTADRDQWEGELKFIRGLLYFELVKTYAYIPTAVIAANDKGGVPLRLKGINSATTAANDLPPRDTINKVYTQIYDDLNVAIAKLNNSRGVAFATRAAARALLSRVALYRGDYPTVITQATSALTEGVGKLLPANQYIAGWRTSVHPESMFEVRFATQAENIGVNTSLQTSYTSLVTAGTLASSGLALATPANHCQLGGFGDLVPNSFLLGQLGITLGAQPSSASCATSTPVPGVINRGPDVRALLYEWGAFRGATANVETTKFLGKNGSINLDNVPVIRFPELYLNRAEAHYFQGATTLALQDVNAIRNARNLPDAVGLTGTALLDEILKQRMLEFAFEGHRFFDLKRHGRDIVKSPANVPFNDTRILAPIPTAELDANPNVKQNPGY